MGGARSVVTGLGICISIRGQGSEDSGQRSEISGQRSGVGGQKAEVRDQGSMGGARSVVTCMGSASGQRAEARRSDGNQRSEGRADFSFESGRFQGPCSIAGRSRRRALRYARSWHDDACQLQGIERNCIWVISAADGRQIFMARFPCHHLWICGEGLSRSFSLRGFG